MGRKESDMTEGLTHTHTHTHSTTAGIQGLALSEQARRVTDRRRERRWEMAEPRVISNRGQAAKSLTPDVDATGLVP